MKKYREFLQGCGFCKSAFGRATIHIAILLTLTHSHLSFGATILQISSDTLVNDAALIFEGEVTAAGSTLDDNGYIFTNVEFIVTDVLTNNPDVGETITLIFLGGTIDGRTMDVGSTIPSVGEKGVYFVEDLNTIMINPLIGWSQGHFTIDEQGMVRAGNAEVVQNVEATLLSGTQPFSLGVAAGIHTVPASNSSIDQLKRKPLTVLEFKAAILELRR